MKKLVLFFIFLTFYVSCSGMPETNPDEPVYGKAGKEFYIVLGSNPSTGYHWVILEPSDKEIAVYLHGEYEPDDKIIKAAGSSGKTIFIFKANKPGETQITFGYFGPYDNHETDEPAFAVTFSLKIIE